MSPFFSELNEAIFDHGNLHNDVAAYAEKPDGSKAVAAVGATDKCWLGQWLANGGVAQQLPNEHVALKEAHERFHKTVATTVAQADARTLPEGALSDKGDLKASLVQLCSTITDVLFKG
ncbi:MAG: CZB domain-containing protein [Polyangiaceae bacterium]